MCKPAYVCHIEVDWQPHNLGNSCMIATHYLIITVLFTHHPPF